MSYSLREYQRRAVQAAIEFYQDKRAYNGIEIIPTGAGKSLIIAEVAKELNQPTLALQPSKEILEQNYDKYTAYGYEAGVYSASMGRKDLGDVTFATVGSIIRKPELFSGVRCIIQDECHMTNAKGGMYDDLFKMLPDAKVLGLTATPYRLSSSSFGSVLKFLTRTKPRVFSEVLYTVQVGELRS